VEKRGKIVSEYLKKYKFQRTPLEIKYSDKEPLKLTKEFVFYHNKSRFRKELTRLQNITKKYLNTTLLASGIRDSYINEDITEKFLILLFTTKGIQKKANEIVESHLSRTFNKNCYFIEVTSEYMLLLAKDLNGIITGIDTMEEILSQTLEHFFEQKKFDDYIKIRPFELYNCETSP
jgi:hypothetical protein